MLMTQIVYDKPLCITFFESYQIIFNLRHPRSIIYVSKI